MKQEVIHNARGWVVKGWIRAHQSSISLIPMLGQVKSGEKCKTCSLSGIAEPWPRFIGGSAWATDGEFTHKAFTEVKQHPLVD